MTRNFHFAVKVDALLPLKSTQTYYSAMAGAGAADGEGSVGDCDGGGKGGGSDDAAIDYTEECIGVVSAAVIGAVGEVEQQVGFITEKTGRRP